MIVLVLYVLVNGVPMEQGIRSTDGVNYDNFPTMAACEKQAKNDMETILVPQFGEKARKELKLVCEQRPL